MRCLQTKIAGLWLVQSALENHRSAHRKNAQEILLHALPRSLGRAHETGGIFND